MSASLEEIALRLAPSLRDKFDLSGGAQWGNPGDPSGIDQWVDLSFKAAAAFKAKAQMFENAVSAVTEAKK